MFKNLIVLVLISLKKQLVFEKIKDLEVGNFSNDKALKGKYKRK